MDNRMNAFGENFQARLSKLFSSLPPRTLEAYRDFIVNTLQQDPTKITAFEAWAEQQRMEGEVNRKRGLPLGGKAYGLDQDNLQTGHPVMPWNLQSNRQGYDQYMNFIESMAEDQKIRVDGMFRR